MAESALDLFSGVGWGVALDWLGIMEHAVDIEPIVGETRKLNGMSPVIYRDVWDGLRHPNIVPQHRILIASPVCQTFSMAGNGAGRAALDQVLAAVADNLWTDYERLRELESTTDPRTALVLIPLAYVYQFAPEVVILEQVPPVLPVWRAIADVLRDFGYSVWTDVVSAEQYGVPQTRKRAILVARRDGVPIGPPPPTHSRYYPREPDRLDPGVLPWVSMAEALGWTDLPGAYSRPSYTVTAEGTATGDAEIFGRRAREAMSSWLHDGPGAWAYRRPATTVVGTFRPERIAEPKWRTTQSRQDGDYITVTIDQAAILQSFPPGFRFAGAKGRQFLQVGNAVPPVLAEAIIRSVLR